MSQLQLLNIALETKDVVYTPAWVARDMVQHFNPTGRILEPCSGDGVFLKYLPTAEWCEIEQGRDFFAYNEPVDWIIGNPPYSIYSRWMSHSMEIAKHICYLIPINKPFNGSKNFKMWFDWGRIIHLRYYAGGRSLGFPIGYACGAVYFQRDYFGPMYSSIAQNAAQSV